MQILIASAEPEDARIAADMGAAGIITNPRILAETGPDWRRRLAAAADLVDGPIHMQTTERNADRILEQFDQFQRLTGDRLVATICISRHGMAAARKLQESLVPTSITAVVTFNQAVVAAQAGADYVSVCIEDADMTAQGSGSDAGELIELVAGYLTRHSLETRIIATDLQSSSKFARAAQCGAHFAAAPAALLTAVICHQQTDAAIAGFETAWKSIRAIK